MKPRRYHNNNGNTQIKRGKCYNRVKKIAKKLGIKYKED